MVGTAVRLVADNAARFIQEVTSSVDTEDDRSVALAGTQSIFSHEGRVGVDFASARTLKE